MNIDKYVQLHNHYDENTEYFLYTKNYPCLFGANLLLSATATGKL